jgi:integrase
MPPAWRGGYSATGLSEGQNLGTLRHTPYPAASSMLNESGLWNTDAIERQLEHVDNDGIRRAYACANFWEERVRMMAWWADCGTVLWCHCERDATH